MQRERDFWWRRCPRAYESDGLHKNSTTMVLRMVRLASLARPSRLRDVSSLRFNSTLASAAYTAPTFQDVSTSKTAEELNPIDRRRLESMLRVDHAGEVAANTIYAAQARVFSSIMGDTKTAKMCEEMWETEKKHLAVAKRLLDQHRTRPSFLMPVWGAAGSVLGGATALLGKEAAMACTEAVETVIGEHYDE